MKSVSVYQIRPEELSKIPMSLLVNSDIGIEALSCMYKSDSFYDFCYMYNTSKDNVGDIIESTFEEGNFNSELINEFLYRTISSGDVITIDDEVFMLTPTEFKKIV